MPNWCECELYIDGPRSEVQRLREYVKSDEWVLDEDKIIPYPRKFRRLDAAAERHAKEHPDDWSGRPKDGFNSGGYEWCSGHWGTKWGFCNVQQPIETKRGGVRYFFDTAWSPPMPLIVKLGELFPGLRLKLKYFECGCAFQGVLVMSKGKVESDKRGHYSGHRGG